MGGGRADFHIVGRDPKKTVMVGPGVEISLGKDKGERYRKLHSRGSEAIHSQNGRVNVKSMHRRKYVCSFG